jgi:hypothetical protein
MRKRSAAIDRTVGIPGSNLPNISALSPCLPKAREWGENPMIALSKFDNLSIFE